MRDSPAYLTRRGSDLVLKASGLRKSFARGLARAAEGTIALRDVDLELRYGEIVGVAGCEAAGKTTLLQCLSGFLRRDAGRIDVYGEPLDEGGRDPRIAYVPAVPLFYPFLTVRDVLEYRAARKIVRVTPGEEVDWALRTFELEQLAQCHISLLSRETIRRVAIAEAMIDSPAVVLADTSVPDGYREFVDDSMRALARCAETGTAVVVASRDAVAVASVATRLLMLDRGRLTRAFQLYSFGEHAVEDVPGWNRGARFVAERVH